MDKIHQTIYWKDSQREKPIRLVSIVIMIYRPDQLMVSQYVLMVMTLKFQNVKLAGSAQCMSSIY